MIAFKLNTGDFGNYAIKFLEDTKIDDIVFKKDETACAIRLEGDYLFLEKEDGSTCWISRKAAVDVFEDKLARNLVDIVKVAYVRELQKDDMVTFFLNNKEWSGCVVESKLQCDTVRLRYRPNGWTDNHFEEVDIMHNQLRHRLDTIKR